jgi:hypothetical protein
MRRILYLAVLMSSCLFTTSLLRAQEYTHGEVGVFADYFRLGDVTPQFNFVGLGGRAAFNIRPSVALEAEMNYDFDRNYTTTFSNGVTTAFARTSVRPLSALFGPAFKVGGSGPFRAFVTGKVGLINFTVSGQNPGAGFQSAVGQITTGDTRFAFYPGAGIEGFWGPFGLRLDAGDEMYFLNGTHNNIKVEFGPHLRF